MRPLLSAIASIIFVSGCSIGMPWPWRLDLSIDRIEVVQLLRAEWFEWAAEAEKQPNEFVRTLRIDVSSTQNAMRYFGSGLATDCHIGGATSGGPRGPFRHGQDLSRLSAERALAEAQAPPDPDGRYRYTIFAFFGLQVGEWQRRPAGGQTLVLSDLTTRPFERISCVLRTPQVFGVVPRSEEVTITEEQFGTAVRASVGHQPSD